MHPKLEAIMARGRAAGVTQRVADEVSLDGRTLRLAADDREVLSFATCSYLGLSRDPRLVAGAVEAAQRYGVSFSASRCFVTSPFYQRAEALLDRVFGRPTVLAGSTTLAHGSALPILVHRHDVVLFDKQVHHSVQTALTALGHGRPRREAVEHGDLDALETAVRGAIAQGARRVWYCADGIYSMLGDRLDVNGLVDLMRRYEPLHAYLDDAHGMSWCGTHGAGSLVDAPLPHERTVLVSSLGKGFGCMGGVIAVPDELTRQRIQNLGPALMFSIQLPPSVVGSIVACAELHLTDEIERMQHELHARMEQARSLVLADPRLGPRLASADQEITPINYLVLGEADQAITATQRLLARGILVNPVCFPVVPMGMAGLRFTISRGHTAEDVRALVRALGEVVDEVCPPAARQVA